MQPTTIEKFKKDVSDYKIAVIEESKNEAERLKKIWKEKFIQNRNFTGYFVRYRKALYTWSDPLENAPGSSRVFEKTFTKDVIEEFEKWRDLVNDELLLNFFKESSLVQRPNLFTLHNKHKAIHSQSANTSSYQDHALLAYLDISHVYGVIVKACALQDIIDRLDEIQDDTADKIDVFYKYWKSDPYLELRGMKNTFNTMSVEQLINYFNDLNKTVKGQKGPIVTPSEFINLIKSICRNEVLQIPIVPSLQETHHPTLRRLFFDFFQHDKKLKMEGIHKADYMKFAANFEPYKLEAKDPKWIQSSTSKNQKRTLADILKRKYP